MKYTPTTNKFHDTIHLVDQTTPVQGGTPVFDAQGNPIKGASNASRVQLADNIAYLKKGLETATTVVDGETTSTLDTYVKETRSDVGALEVRADDLDANKSVKFANYTALGNYTGKATAADITSAGIAGRFYRRGTAAENGGTVLKDAMGRSWEREFSGAVNVLWFGAKGDGGHDDTQAINDAIAFGPGSVFFPDGIYATTAPIYTDGNISLRGASKGKVRINKTTNTPGVGSNLALDGTEDDYAQNAVIILRHPDKGYNYGTSIRDITLESMFISDYGIYAPRASGLFLENVSIVGCRVGYQTHDSWMCQFNRVEVDAVTRAGLAGDTYGWKTKSYGFVFTPKVASTPTGTSCTFNSCWAHDCHIGWEINYLEYSTLNSCGADNISNGPYRFTNSGLTLNSCATENVQLNYESALAVVGGNVTLNSFRAYRIRGGTSGTTAMLYADGARVVLNTCRLDDFFQVNSGFNVVIQNGSTVVNHNSRLTGNGNAYVSYSGGSVLTMMGASNPHVITSTGIKFFAFAP